MSSVPVPAFGPLYGALYFATLISTAFYGMTWMQAYLYFLRYQNDHLRMKGFVVLLWAMNTVHQALTISGTYKHVKLGLESPIGWIYGIPDIVLVAILTSVIAVLVQGFFVYRIYTFSGKKIIVPLIWVPLALYQLVESIIYVVKTLIITPSGLQAVNATVLNDTFLKDIGASYCAVTAGVDVLIAISMTFLLIRQRCMAGFTSTSTVVLRLAILAVISGTWTAVFAVMSAVLMLVYSSNVIWSVFFIPLCSLYCNTLLANLNARAYLKGGISHPSGTGIAMSTLSDPNEANSKPELMSPNNTRIRKTIEVVTFSDTDESYRV